MSYMGYCNDESDIIHIAKRLKTGEEVIEVIEESIATANKCLLYLVVKERELNE